MKKARTVIGIIISLLFLFLAFKNVNFRDIVSIIKKVDISFLIIPIILSCVGLFQRTLRWGYLLNPQKKEKFFNLFSVLMLGYLGNNILPARMGEVLRIYTLDKNYGYSKSLTLATIVLEKVFDILALLCFFSIVLFFAPFPSWVKNGGILLGIGIIGITAFLYLFTHKKQEAFRLANFLASPLPEKAVVKIKEILENFDSGLRILKKKKDIMIVIVYSVGIWLTEFFFVYLILGSFNLHLSIFAPVFLVIMLNLGMLIPSSPGYIGTYQVMCIAALSPFGVEKELALSISIVLHILMLSITTVIGMICFWRENLKIKEKGTIPSF